MRGNSDTIVVRLARDDANPEETRGKGCGATLDSRAGAQRSTIRAELSSSIWHRTRQVRDRSSFGRRCVVPWRRFQPWPTTERSRNARSGGAAIRRRGLRQRLQRRLAARQHMAVDVECEGHGRVTEALGRHPDVRSGREQVGGVSVAKVVQADPRKVASLDEAREGSGDHVRMPTGTIGHREDEPESVHSGPSSSLLARCRARSERNTRSVTGSRSTTRRDRVDFTSPSDG